MDVGTAEVQVGEFHPHADRRRTIGAGLIELVLLETGQSAERVGGGIAGVEFDGTVAIGHHLVQLVLGRVGLGTAGIAHGVGRRQADAGREILDRLGQVALLLLDLATDAVRQDALRVQLDRLGAIGQGAGSVFQAHADRRPRGPGLGVTGVQVQHGREIGQRGREIGLGLFRRAGAIAIDAGARNRASAWCGSSTAPLDVRHAWSNLPSAAEPAPGQAPIRFVRFEFDGQVGVGKGLVGLPQSEVRPAPGDDGFRPARPPPHGLVEILQGLLLPSGHAEADGAGQVGLGNIVPSPICWV